MENVLLFVVIEEKEEERVRAVKKLASGCLLARFAVLLGNQVRQELYPCTGSEDAVRSSRSRSASMSVTFGGYGFPMTLRIRPPCLPAIFQAATGRPSRSKGFTPFGCHLLILFHVQIKRFLLGHDKQAGGCHDPTS